VNLTTRTTDEDFRDGLRTLAFEAAKRHVEDLSATLANTVELHSTAAVVRMHMSNGDAVRVHVAYTGVCSVITFADDIEETQPLPILDLELDEPVPFDLTERARRVFAERGNF
jgi:hypothetical protein